MNRDSVLQYLLNYLSKFSYHSKFLGELIDIIAGSGYEGAFFNLLVVRLGQLSKLGISAVELKEFENIGRGLYSMHFFKKNFNIRFLYAFMPNGQPVFLIPFFERSGKRMTDYTPYIEPALSRLAEMREDYENGF